LHSPAARAATGEPEYGERSKSRERLLRTILFYSGHLQHGHERPDMERYYMNSDKAQWK